VQLKSTLNFMTFLTVYIHPWLKLDVFIFFIFFLLSVFPIDYRLYTSLRTS